MPTTEQSGPDIFQLLARSDSREFALEVSNGISEILNVLDLRESRKPSIEESLSGQFTAYFLSLALQKSVLTSETQTYLYAYAEALVDANLPEGKSVVGVYHEVRTAVDRVIKTLQKAAGKPVESAFPNSVI